MNKVGRNGYVKKTGAVLEAASKLRKGIEKIEHLDVMGDPVGSVIAFCSKTINVFQVSDLFLALNRLKNLAHGKLTKRFRLETGSDSISLRSSYFCHTLTLA